MITVIVYAKFVFRGHNHYRTHEESGERKKAHEKIDEWLATMGRIGFKLVEQEREEVPYVYKNRRSP